MKNLFLSICLSASALFFLSACSNSSKGELLKESTKSFVRENLDYKTDYHKKRIAVDGYLWIGSLRMENNKLNVALYTKPGGAGDQLLDIATERADSPNAVMFPMKNGKSAGYNTTEHEINLDQMTFRDNDNNQFPVSQKMRVSGTVTYVENFQSGFSKMPDPLNKGKELYPFTLESARFDIVQ